MNVLEIRRPLVFPKTLQIGEAQRHLRLVKFSLNPIEDTALGRDAETSLAPHRTTNRAQCSPFPPMSLDIEECYRKYGPMVRRRCQALLKDPQLAADLTQDVFVQVLRKQASLQDKGLSSLFYRIATNLCLNHIRDASRRPGVVHDDTLHKIAVAQGALGQRVEAKSMLQALFRDNIEDYGATAVLHWVDGMTHKEVAEALGMSVSGVRKRLAKIQAKVQECFPEETTPCEQRGSLA